MDTTVIHFSKFLGKKILHEDQEYILHAVSPTYLAVLNGSMDTIPKAIDECKIIVNSENDIFIHEIPLRLVVLRTKEGYESFDENRPPKTDDEKEAEIVKSICDCAGITIDQLRAQHKYRKRVYVQARQVHMVIRNLVIRKNESTATTGAVYGKDHATFLNAKKRVLNALDGYDTEFRERFRDVFLLTRSYYPDKASKQLELDWL